MYIDNNRLLLKDFVKFVFQKKGKMLLEGNFEM